MTTIPCPARNPSWPRLDASCAALTAAFFALTAASLPAQAAEPPFTEALEMGIDGLTLHAPGPVAADLDIAIGYRDGMTQDDYPDFIALRKALGERAGDPNWPRRGDGTDPNLSRLAVALAAQTLADTPNVARAAVTLHAKPAPERPWPFTVRAVAERATPDASALSLTVPLRRFGLMQQGPNVVDLTTTVALTGAGDAPPLPEPAALRETLVRMLVEYPNEDHYWETMLKAMQRALVAEYPGLSGIDMVLRVYPTATVDYFHTVTARTGTLPGS